MAGVTELTDTALRQLADRVAVHDVLMRYTRGIDRRDWELVRSCYHNDAYDDHAAYQGDRDGFVEWVARSLPHFEYTMHFIGNQLIEVDGDVAHAESYCVAYHRRAATGDEPEQDLIMGLRYVDRLERRNGEWRIAHRVCAMDWTRTDPVTAKWDFPPETTRGLPYPNDVVYRGR